MLKVLIICKMSLDIETRGYLRYFREDFQFAPLPALQQYRMETIFRFVNLSVGGLSCLEHHLLEH